MNGGLLVRDFVIYICDMTYSFLLVLWMLSYMCINKCSNNINEPKDSNSYSKEIQLGQKKRIGIIEFAALFTVPSKVL